MHLLMSAAEGIEAITVQFGFQRLDAELSVIANNC